MTRRSRRLPWLVLAVVLLGGFLSAGSAWWFYTASGPLMAARDIVVPRGNTDTVLRALQAAGVIRRGAPDSAVFRLAVALTRHDGALHAAELSFPTEVSIRGVIQVLRHAPPVQHRLTIPEGLTVRQVTGILLANDALTGVVPAFSEGSLLPQTLTFTRGTARAAIVARLQRLMTQTLADIWAQRDPTVTLPGPQAMLVLASIVERETGLSQERPQVAQVFLNRLRLGMKLQSDPTVIYDLSDGLGVLDRPLTHLDLSELGPENTYRIPALPPQPIGAPGRAALEAVAHPSGGAILYFVATGTGGHYFADNLEDHNRHVDAYRTARMPR